MSLVIHDESLANELLAERRASGADRYDEVWEGVYVMAPMADNDHQRLVSQLTAAISSVVDWQGLGQTLAGANVSDRKAGWRQNYRIPDVLVFFHDTAAEDCGTHFYGGPDFAIELASRGDATLAKIEFYAAIGTQELLVIDRDPWQLTLYQRHDAKQLVAAAISSFTQQGTIRPARLAATFALVAESRSLRIEHPDGELIRQWVLEK
jgi:Uma2 family endonuclease